MDDEIYNKLFEKRKARKIQKETGMKYTEALRMVRAGKIELKEKTDAEPEADEYHD